MTDPVKEQLSACLDGELTDAELSLLVKRVNRDAEHQATLGRYALISEAMRDRPVAASSAFAAKVMASLDQETTAAPRRQASGAATWATRLRPVAGIAIAAGVAALAVFSIQQPGVPAGEPLAATDTPVAALIEPSASSSPSYVVPTGTNSSGFIQATRLTNYVMAHSEYSSPLGRRTVLSGVLSDDDQTAQDLPANDLPAEQTEQVQER